MTKNFVPSPFQTAVYQHITETNRNCVIDAVAGSGKSTTIVNALSLIPKNKTVLFLAFNKAIVEELKVKVGSLNNVEIKTLHSLGMGSIRKYYKTFVNASKYGKHINSGVKYGTITPDNELEAKDLRTWRTNLIKLTDLARNYLAVSALDVEEIANKHDVQIIDNEAVRVIEIIMWGKSNVRTIDFTDMVWLPNVLKINVEQFDYVFIDECQDLNTAQRELFLQTIKPETGRFIAVGDPRQAIYGFTGADVESFNKLKNLPNTDLLPLSVCYRCDSEIIDLAKAIVPQIQAHENAATGTIDNNASIQDILDNDMVLCRVTAPLVALCMNFIANSTKAYVKGRDIGLNLINMLEKTDRVMLTEAIDVIYSELGTMCNKIAKRQGVSIDEAKEDAQYQSFRDRIKAIENLSYGLTTVNEAVNRIELIFKDTDKTGICLSTIHKAKGLEADRVFILRPDKLYLKHCMKVDWMAEQERNLVYVAYTRAKHYLGFITDFQDNNSDD
ncbi:MAG: UvrD-helicase domain-containing protein [bacterium]